MADLASGTGDFPAEKARLGVIGGTFDPPHYGHLVLAENARVQLALSAVLFVPAGEPPHKPASPVTPSHHRVAMVEAAIAGNAAFALSRVDLERPGPHYTVDMLGILSRLYPDAALFFLMGGDSLAEFAGWRDPSGIVAQARLVVMERPGWEADSAAVAEKIPSIQDRLTLLDAPYLTLSGTDLRRRARAGLPIRYLVPPAVEAYVIGQSLYQGKTESSSLHLCAAAR
jgi:nicotinate-nucleotide adenylyltransferase